MGREYDKVFNEQEFEAITVIMDKSVKELKGRNADMFNMPGYVDYEGVDKQVLLSAMKKMQPLHRARVCGYISR